MGSNIIYFLAVLPKKGKITYKCSGKAKFSPFIIKEISCRVSHKGHDVFSNIPVAK